MQIAKPSGPAAATRKYDILSALMVHGLSLDKNAQKQVMRFCALITTRYNWQRDELSMGQDAIAALWSVDKRTVKRELAKFQAKGWLVLKRRGARGRVSSYGMDFTRIMEDTRPVWANIGPDFIARVDPDAAPAAQQSNVVPLRSGAAPVQFDGLWGNIQRVLHSEDEATFANWFQCLTEAGQENGCLILAAPSQFHAAYVDSHLKTRLVAAAHRVDPTITGLRIEG